MWCPGYFPARKAELFRRPEFRRIIYSLKICIISGIMAEVYQAIPPDLKSTIIKGKGIFAVLPFTLRKIRKILSLVAIGN